MVMIFTSVDLARGLHHLLRSGLIYSSRSTRPRIRMSHSTARRVLVPVADGSEDVETVAVVDVLRRAGVSVDVASVESGRKAVVLSRGCRLEADALLADCAGHEYDMICIPGGMPGAQRIADSAEFGRTLAAQHAGGRWIAAICAAPAVVLVPHAIIGSGTAATCHANFASRLPGGGDHSGARVVVDDTARLVTSLGPGSAIEWALECVACLQGRDAALAVAKPMHLQPGPDGAPWAPLARK